MRARDSNNFAGLWRKAMATDHELPHLEFPIPREVMRVVDAILPRKPRLEDFGTELLVQHGFQVLQKKQIDSMEEKATTKRVTE